MPVIHHLLKTQPTHALLFRGLADPPTTTLQRLIAMMTGTLPTLVDAGSNFASSAIKEDNLVRHLQAYGAGASRKQVISMGDDTWEGLFPTLLNETFSYPSFDVWDLHTVDLAVKKHLFPILAATMKQPKSVSLSDPHAKNDPTSDLPESSLSSWGLLIAHFLGVDHAGHRYGPGHPAMGDKLIEMNQMLQQVFDMVDEDTLVVVMGDHGMDNKGDHGGDSDNELDAAFFLYSKKPLMDTDGGGSNGSSSDGNNNTDNIENGGSREEVGSDPHYRALYDAISRVDQIGLEGSHPFGYWQGHRCISQIDLVSTVSMLMGVPIPFGNLGSIIPEVFFWSGDALTQDQQHQGETATALQHQQEKRSWWSSLIGLRGSRKTESSHTQTGDLSSKLKIQPMQNLLLTMRINAIQLHNYIKAYGDRRKDAKASFSGTFDLFLEAERLFSVLATKRDTMDDDDPKQYQEDLIACYVAYTHYTRSTLIIARKIWSRFESVLMVMGVMLILLGITVTIGLVVRCVGYGSLSLAAVYIRPAHLAGSFAVSGLVGFAGLIGIATHPNEDPLTLILHSGHEVLFFGVLGLIAALASQIYSLPCIVDSISPSIDITPSKLNRYRSVISVTNQWWPATIGLTLFVMYISCVGSDSFTIFEDHVLLHFLQLYSVVNGIGALLYLGIDAPRRQALVLRSVIFFALTRIIHGSTICRPDQGPVCIPTFNASATSSVTAMHTPVLLAVVIVAVVYAMQGMLRRERAITDDDALRKASLVDKEPILEGSSPVGEDRLLSGVSEGNSSNSGAWNIHIFSSRLFPVSVFLSYLYWVLDTIEAHDAEMPPLMQNAKYYVAKVFWCMIPLSLWLLLGQHGQRKSIVSTVSNSGSGGSVSLGRKEAGLGETHLCLMAFVYVNLAFFQKPMGSVILGLGFLQLLCLADTVLIWRRVVLIDGYQIRLKNMADAEESNGSNNGSSRPDRHADHIGKDRLERSDLDMWGYYVLYVVVLLLCGQKLFFSTGHQNALPSIQYEVGFVGLTSVNWVLSPLFIGLNTFGGSLLCAIAVPLGVVLGRNTCKSHDDKERTGQTMQKPTSDLQQQHADIAKQLVFIAVMYFGVVSASEMASSTGFAGWFKKHSQAWRVWGPKFLFFSISHVGSYVIGILGLMSIKLKRSLQ
ncbi:hypothetical protein BASA50_002831 [Batrachochytrium salamandrivorans]|uniref:GPI ethanolamine phosphate transferase 3 n=1 Tax=Batrachochytrium salamandrivorans TaxID=1357716 RepID=A0ABQ8FK83_9FUNG|nr:hypothetical protein BASA50_002831 [Batrachochytrium salamandrivorans]